MGALERLKELEARGMAMSRNRHFELFEDPSNRQALTLHRYLDALAEELTVEGPSVQWHLEAPTEGDRYVLHITHAEEAFSHQAFLTREELETLETRVGFALRPSQPPP